MDEVVHTMWWKARFDVVNDGFEVVDWDISLDGLRCEDCLHWGGVDGGCDLQEWWWLVCFFVRL